MNKVVLLIVLICLFGLIACLSEEEHPFTEPTLSELMRERFDEMKIVKQAILNDEEVVFNDTIGFIHGIPSREALTTKEFQSELKAFELTYTMLTQEEAESIRNRYEAVVQWCLSCHERHCPGPIRAIKSLRLD